MNTMQINDIKDQVIELREQGNEIQGLNVLKRYFSDDALMSAMDDQQLSYTGDVVLNLVVKSQEEMQYLSAKHPNTNPLRRLLGKIDEVHDSSLDYGTSIWDVSRGIDDAYPASDQQISDLIDVLSGHLASK